MSKILEFYSKLRHQWRIKRLPVHICLLKGLLFSRVLDYRPNFQWLIPRLIQIFWAAVINLFKHSGTHSLFKLLLDRIGVNPSSAIECFVVFVIYMWSKRNQIAVESTHSSQSNFRKFDVRIKKLGFRLTYWIKVASATFLLVWLVSLINSTCETRKMFFISLRTPFLFLR